MVKKSIRSFLYVVGVLALLLGFIGIFVPLLPTTPFVLLSAWCFFKSSPKMHAWLLNHNVLGPPLLNWQNKRAISLKSKVIAICFLALSVLVLSLKDMALVVKWPLIIFLIFIGFFIGTRPQ